MIIEPLEEGTAMLAVDWRNQQPMGLRTGRALTRAQQKEWFHKVAADPTQQWWELGEQFISDGYGKIPCGYCGVEHIQWVNSIGELSFLMDINCLGNWHEGFDLFFKAVRSLPLHAVYAEVYDCSETWDQWLEEAQARDAYLAWVPARKYLDGKWHGANVLTWELS